MAYEDEERHHTYSDVQSQVQPWDEVILRFASGTLVIRPFRGRKRVRWLCADVSLDLGEVLEELDEEVGHLRVRELKKADSHISASKGEAGRDGVGWSYLLSKADSWTSVERKKDERVGN